jgi:hypothetical protein
MGEQVIENLSLDFSLKNVSFYVRWNNTKKVVMKATFFTDALRRSQMEETDDQ